MNIQQATEIVKKDKDKGIRRMIWRKDKLVLKPTDTETCVEMYLDGSLLTNRWNPSAKDLMSLDWEICNIKN